MGLIEQSVRAFVDYLVRGATACRHHRHTGGERLDHGHPQSLRGRGEDEKVGRSVGRRELLAREQTSKDRWGVGEPLLQVLTGRSLADDSKTGVGGGFEGG